MECARIRARGRSMGFFPRISALIVLISFGTFSHALAGEMGAYGYLHKRFKQYHQVFYVYRDAHCGGNHFFPSGWMGDRSDVTFRSDWAEDPHSAPTCIRIIYRPRGRQRWAGIFWQYPENNWGKRPGLDLSGAKWLVFWARGEKGGERAEFKVGLDDGKDASRSHSTGVITLNREWKRYDIPLEGLNLGNLIGGFCWVINARQNPHGATIYLDDISIDLPRPNTPRFIQSFEATAQKEDLPLCNTAFVYDNALALIALLARGAPEDLQAARLLVNAFLFAQGYDRYFKDGRLRNAYRSGDLRDPQGGFVRLPGWRDKKKGKWLEDESQVSTYTGNMAWAMIALLDAHKRFGDERYLQAAIRIGDWIDINCRDSRAMGGYTGGLQGWGDNQRKLLWKSTEHNLDLYAAFERLYESTGEERWHRSARHAKIFVLSMRDEREGHFWTGTLDDGITINRQSVPLDIQAWVILSLKDRRLATAMAWAKAHCFVMHCARGCSVSGFDFNQDRDGIWYEGTSQAALAYLALGNRNEYRSLLQDLEGSQAPSGGIYAASRDDVSTGFGWRYYHRIHLGATCWYIFAKMGFNPYWGRAR